MTMGKIFIYDHNRCNGCRNCQLACKDEHVDNEWPPFAKAQPDTGQFWLRLEEKIRGQVPKVKVSYTVHICQHCDNAPCIKSAPEAIYKRADGLVIIDPEKATGLRALVKSCPYGAIYYNDELDLPQKCTGCAHLIDIGEVPHCVDCCPHQALRFGEETDLVSEISVAEPLIEGTDHAPRVHYLNKPRRFLGGIVVDLEEDEVIIGAKVTIEDIASSQVLVETTDEFGDFWFNQIPATSYRLFVEAEGYMTRTLTVSTVEEDRNVGPINLFVSAYA
jgi:Fe-S-cluster-containing dehydrogenase component